MATIAVAIRTNIFNSPVCVLGITNFIYFVIIYLLANLLLYNLGLSYYALAEGILILVWSLQRT